MPIVSIEELTLLHTNICQALGDPKRIQILYTLHEKPQNVSALASILDMPQPTISRHLAILRQRAMVLPERQGTTVVYSLADPRIIEVLDLMRQVLRSTLERQADLLDS